MTQKSDSKNSIKLTSWLFKEPARFAFMSFVLAACIAMLYSFTSSLLFGTYVDALSWPMWVIVIGVIVYSAYRLIDRLPGNKMDRRNFVSLTTGLMMVYFIMTLFSVLIFIIGTNDIASIQSIMIHNKSNFLLIIMAISVILFYTYILGLMLTGFYATYIRAISMGVPKLKAILSIPFAIPMFWFPGYMLHDNNQTKANKKYFTALVDWIIAKPRNTILMLVFILAFILLIYDYYMLTSMIFFGLIFAIWLAFSGVKNLQKNIGRSYSTIAIAINVATIVFFITLLMSAQTNLPDNVQTLQYEEVQIMESGYKS